MRQQQRSLLASAALIILGATEMEAFFTAHPAFVRTTLLRVTVQSEPATESFIQTELRGAAMKLHTREQSPKEGQVEVTPPKEPYVTTRADYLAFLVDSQHVYKAMEDIVNERDELAVFRNTGLERVTPLEKDIAFMMAEYGLERPAVGKPGTGYAAELRQIRSIPEFICHYYNHHFAHTAGGRMIGKQMSALLLDKKTLEFYKVRRVLADATLTFACLILTVQFSRSTVGWRSQPNKRYS